jgi:N-dimethylarginine dimethylaminohydrolase
MGAKRPRSEDGLTEILAKIPANWPITSENGKIVVADKFEGRQLIDVVGSDAAKILVEKHIFDLNQQAEKIRAETNVTQNPAIVMGQPQDRTFKARLGWHALKTQIEASGGTVEVLSSESSYGVWTRDRWIPAAERPVFTEGTTPEPDTKPERGAMRQAGHEAARHTLEQRGVKGPVLEGALEGGDVIQHHRSNTVFVGIEVYDDGSLHPDHLRTATNLAEHLGMKLVPVPKTNRSPFYHLDTFMAALPDGSIIVIPDATTPEALAEIRQVAGNNLLELGIKEGERMAHARRKLATNIITVNGNVFTANALPEIREFVEQRGYRLIEGPFQLMDSGPRCQTNFLKHTPEKERDGRSDISRNEPHPLEYLLASNGFPSSDKMPVTRVTEISPSIAPGGDGSRVLG